MALLDFLKNKEDAKKAKEKKAPVKKAEKASVATEMAVEVAKEAKAPKTKAAVSGKFSYEVVREPHISEKANILSEKNKYTFLVHNNANKPEVKKAVEGIYGVNVLTVNMISIAKKKRRLGKTQGYKKAYRKAVVTIKEGQKIEVF